MVLASGHTIMDALVIATNHVTWFESVEGAWTCSRMLSSRRLVFAIIMNIRYTNVSHYKYIINMCQHNHRVVYYITLLSYTSRLHLSEPRSLSSATRSCTDSSRCRAAVRRTTGSRRAATNRKCADWCADRASCADTRRCATPRVASSAARTPRGTWSRTSCNRPGWWRCLWRTTPSRSTWRWGTPRSRESPGPSSSGTCSKVGRRSWVEGTRRTDTRRPPASRRPAYGHGSSTVRCCRDAVSPTWCRAWAVGWWRRRAPWGRPWGRRRRRRWYTGCRCAATAGWWWYDTPGRRQRPDEHFNHAVSWDKSNRRAIMSSITMLM